MSILLKACARKRSAAASSLLTLAMSLAAAACGITASPQGDLAEYRRLLSTCESGKSPAVLVAMDATGSSNSAAITSERLTALEQIITRTAVCSGRLRVVAFSSSSVATQTLLDRTLRPYGATVNARLKRVPELVNQSMIAIRRGYGLALATLPGGGSDITGQLRLAAEWQRQLDGDSRLQFFVFTDGFQNVGRRLDGKGSTGKTSPPRLSGAIVTFAGLGRTGGRPPRSEVVERLVADYQRVCGKTGAARCLAVTDYATTDGR